MFKVFLLAGLLATAGCADAKSSGSSSARSSSSSYKSSSSNSSSARSSSSSYKPKPSFSGSSTTIRPASTSSSRCTGSVKPSVVWDWDDREYEYECPTKREMNRFGSCVCK